MKLPLIDAFQHFLWKDINLHTSKNCYINRRFSFNFARTTGAIRIQKHCSCLFSSSIKSCKIEVKKNLSSTRGISRSREMSVFILNSKKNKRERIARGKIWYLEEHKYIYVHLRKSVAPHYRRAYNFIISDNFPHGFPVSTERYSPRNVIHSW